MQDGQKADTDALLTQKQAANLLGLSPRTLEGWRYRGTPEPGLPFVKFGLAVRYRKSDVIAFRNARLRSSTSDDGQ